MEEWRDVINYEGLYQVSNLGRVRSLDRVIERTINGTTFQQMVRGRMLKCTNGTNGYIFADLCKSGKIYRTGVHRMVASAFIPNPNDLPCINHKDRNKKNNKVENLEWCDYEYNNNYGGAKPQWGHNRKQVEQLTMEGEHVAYFSSTAEAGRVLNLNPIGIQHVCKGRKPSMYGFKWRYTNG